jgi:hypothetical protein
MSQVGEFKKSIWKEKAVTLNLNIIIDRNTQYGSDRIPSHCFFYILNLSTIESCVVKVVWFKSQKEMVDFLKYELPLLYISRHIESENVKQLSHFLTDLQYFFSHSIDSFESSILNYQSQIEMFADSISIDKFSNIISSNLSNLIWFEKVKWDFLYIGSTSELPSCKRDEIQSIFSLFPEANNPLFFNDEFRSDLSKFLEVESINRDILNEIKNLQKYWLIHKSQKISCLDEKIVISELNALIDTINKGIEYVEQMIQTIAIQAFKQEVDRVIKMNKSIVSELDLQIRRRFLNV